MTSLLVDSGSPIAYYPDLVPLVGSVNATILLCQLIYWTGKQHDPNGWIRKESKELQKETGLTKDQQETARKQLRNLGIVEEKRKGTPPKLHFRINKETLLQLWEKHQIKRGDSPQLKRRKKDTCIGSNSDQQASTFPAHISESTQEITQKNTPETGNPSRFISNEEEREREIKLKEDRAQQGEWNSMRDILHQHKSRPL